MLSLLAIIGADANPMRRELAAVQAMAKRAGVNIQAGLAGGDHANAGAMRETLVLMREISRGNWTRVPGSFVLLLQRLGALNLLMGKTAGTERILADAWQKQAEKASLAAVMATRKAGASMAAFNADEAEAEATMNTALADEAKMNSSIAVAAATREKAEASMEAAAAAELEGGATVVSLGVIGGILAVVAVGALMVYETFWGMRKALEGMEIPNLKLDYIPRMLTSANDTLNMQKKITEEINKTTEAYNSAAAAAGRISQVTNEHFAHLRKMNEFEKDPAKKAARELEINKQEREAQLENKRTEQASLRIESLRKQDEAGAIKVHTKEEDESIKKGLDQKAAAAEIFLEKMRTGDTWENVKTKLAIGLGGNPLKMMERKRQVEAAMAMNEDEANSAIASRDKFADRFQTNEGKRKQKDEAKTAAATAAAASTKLGLEIPDIEKANAQKNKDEAEEMQAKLNSERKLIHGSVDSLQKVGAYTGPATTNLDSLAQKQLVLVQKQLALAQQQLVALQGINRNTGKQMVGRGGMGKVTH